MRIVTNPEKLRLHFAMMLYVGIAFLFCFLSLDVFFYMSFNWQMYYGINVLLSSVYKFSLVPPIPSDPLQRV